MKDKNSRMSLYIIGGIFIFAVLGIVYLAANSSSKDDGVVKNIDDWGAGAPANEAHVTIVEYADFQCPACASMHPIIKQLQNEYPDTVRVIYKHYPLTTLHANAFSAAEAAEAAGAQGKFWEMHDLLFENQGELSMTLYLRLADQLGLDVKRFERELKSGYYRADVNADLSEAKSFGLSGTPTIFINGTQLSPGEVPSYEQMKAEIDRINSTWVLPPSNSSTSSSSSSETTSSKPGL